VHSSQDSLFRWSFEMGFFFSGVRVLGASDSRSSRTGDHSPNRLTENGLPRRIGPAKRNELPLSSSASLTRRIQLPEHVNVTGTIAVRERSLAEPTATETHANPSARATTWLAVHCFRRYRRERGNGSSSWDLGTFEIGSVNIVPLPQCGNGH